MAIITTPAASNANSYVSVAEAKEYLAANAAFMALTDAAIETLLQKATMHIDTMRFVGEKYRAEQALKFPRVTLDEYGVEIASSEIPSKVKMATCEQAAHILDGNGSKRLQLQSDGVTSFRIGDVSESLAGRNVGELSISADAKGLLKGLITRLGRVVNY